MSTSWIAVSHAPHISVVLQAVFNSPTAPFWWLEYVAGLVAFLFGLGVLYWQLSKGLKNSLLIEREKLNLQHKSGILERVWRKMSDTREALHKAQHQLQFVVNQIDNLQPDGSFDLYVEPATRKPVVFAATTNVNNLVRQLLELLDQCYCIHPKVPSYSIFLQVVHFNIMMRMKDLVHGFQDHSFNLIQENLGSFKPPSAPEDVRQMIRDGCNSAWEDCRVLSFWLRNLDFELRHVLLVDIFVVPASGEALLKDEKIPNLRLKEDDLPEIFAYLIATYPEASKRLLDIEVKHSS